MIVRSTPVVDGVYMFQMDNTSLLSGKMKTHGVRGGKIAYGHFKVAGPIEGRIELPARFSVKVVLSQ